MTPDFQSLTSFVPAPRFTTIKILLNNIIDRMNEPEKNAADADDRYVFTKQVGNLLRRAYQRHVSIFQHTIPDSQLTAAQFVVMCAIRSMPSCSLSDVVKATAIDQATVRGIIERLKTRLLIEIAQDTADRRKVSLALSPSGADLVEKPYHLLSA